MESIRRGIDVLFLGSSHVHCNVNTQLLWDEYGMAAYLMTGAEQPLWNSYYNLKEALKTQKPRLVVPLTHLKPKSWARWMVWPTEPC